MQAARVRPRPLHVRPVARLSFLVVGGAADSVVHALALGVRSARTRRIYTLAIADASGQLGHSYCETADRRGCRAVQFGRLAGYAGRASLLCWAGLYPAG
jgi:hypothetical protein